jgi:hypothetical protein
MVSKQIYVVGSLAAQERENTILPCSSAAMHFTISIIHYLNYKTTPTINAFLFQKFQCVLILKIIVVFQKKIVKRLHTSYVWHIQLTSIYILH